MKKMPSQRKQRRGLFLLLSILLVFCMFGTIVYAVARRTSREMSAAAIQNLNESLDLIQCTIEAILNNEAEFQGLVARELARAEDPEAFIRAYERSRTMVKMSFILSGQTQGVSNTGEAFTEDELDFSAGQTVGDMPVSRSYLNYMGTWAYTIKCPVERDGRELGVLYVEYVYDTIDRALPAEGFYNKQATLYIMDAQSQRFVLKPKGMGQRSAGHLNLDDFYRANSLQDPDIQAEVSQCLTQGKDILFYHDIRGVNALNYMWSVNGGTIFLVGYVPVQAIQQEGRTVNQNIIMVVAAMMGAFFLCVLLYYLSWRQQERLRREQEEERRLHSQQLSQALQAAQHGVHGGADVVGHVGQEGGLRLAGNLGCLECLSQLLAVELPFLLPLPAQLFLLFPVQIVQGDAQGEGGQQRGHDDHDVLVDRPALLLDGLNRHIAHQEDGAAVYRPHVIECVHLPNIVVKQDVPALAQAVCHFRLDCRILNVVCPVEICQVQVSRAALAHSLGLENKALALGVHDVQRRLLVVKPFGGEGLVDGVVDILGVEGPNLLAGPFHGALYGVGPGAHVVHIGLGDRQPRDRSARGEVQVLLGKTLPGVGESFCLSGKDQRQLCHGLILLVSEDIGHRVVCPGDFPGNQRLKLSLAVQNCFDGALD